MITNRSVAFFAFLLGLAGCGEAPLVHVTGTVKYQGVPVPAGTIFFDPDESVQNAPQGYAVIKDGMFSTAEARSQGVKPGKYNVRIRGYDGKPGSELPLGRPIFDERSETRDIAGPTAELEFDFKKSK